MNISSSTKHTCTHSSPYFLGFKTETLVSLKKKKHPKTSQRSNNTYWYTRTRTKANTCTQRKWTGYEFFILCTRLPENTMTCDHLPLITPLWPNCYLMPQIAFVTVLQFTGCIIMPLKGVFDIALHYDTGIPLKWTGISTFVRIDNTRSPALKA